MPRSIAGNRPSTLPITVQEPVANGNRGRYRFGVGTSMAGPSKSARPCYVQNKTTQPVYVRVNAYDTFATGAWYDASATVFDVEIANGAQYEVSELGTISVQTLSIFVPTGGTVGLLYVRGFTE